MIFMVMKKIKLTESDLYRIIKQVLLEQEDEKRSFTFSPGAFESIITSSSGERFVKHLNNKYDEIIVNGDLILYKKENLKYLPDNLRVEGSLILLDTPIQSLPDNLYVKGSLSLEGTPIQSLPDNLHVEGMLYLKRTQIQSLPNNLHVGKGVIYIYGTPLNDNDKLVAKYEEKYTIIRRNTL